MNFNRILCSPSSKYNHQVKTTSGPRTPVTCWNWSSPPSKSWPWSWESTETSRFPSRKLRPCSSTSQMTSTTGADKQPLSLFSSPYCHVISFCRRSLSFWLVCGCRAPFSILREHWNVDWEVCRCDEQCLIREEPVWWSINSSTKPWWRWWRFSLKSIKWHEFI